MILAATRGVLGEATNDMKMVGRDEGRDGHENMKLILMLRGVRRAWAV